MFTLRNKKLRTTADPTATPPAVAAIWLNMDGCWGWAMADAGAGAGVAGGACAGTLLRGGAALKTTLGYLRCPHDEIKIIRNK